ncbi:hypothetical protein A1O1_05842 [Capronia coronata CBS 617.96]|uniref:Uncharacterized protein n=1 Tax=Capronia coronata CBS 617.96 TaxID=1182541 RepID=W9XZ32_9EURO|nr:uncharacterized protein A1O1_05842 [Capronia coronata CBS 617.96]EXJ85478.1 hypothetical protein A1O1_05842 [Capronia coronata CBS 617.96]
MTTGKRQGSTKNEDIDRDRDRDRDRDKDKDKDKDVVHHQRKSQRLEKSCREPTSAKHTQRTSQANSQKPSAAGETIHSHTTNSKGKETREESITTAEKRSHARPTPTPSRGGQRPVHGITATTRSAQKQLVTSMTSINSVANLSCTAKRQTCEIHEDESNHPAKPRRGLAQYTEARTRPLNKEEFIESWLEESFWSRRTLTQAESRLGQAVVNMPRKPAPAFPPTRDVSEGRISSSSRSEKSVASVHDADY